MNRWNNLMANHFRSCKQIAEDVDEHRGRIQKIFYIGSLFDVGVSDGVDSWVIPVGCKPKMNLLKLVTSCAQSGSLPRRQLSAEKPQRRALNV
jgi:hypothetical protein